MDSVQPPPTSAPRFNHQYELHRSEHKFVVLVTGAGSGIGRATARKLLVGGHSVVCADCDLPGAEETVRLATGDETHGDSLHSSPSVTERALACKVDVRSSASCEAMMEKIVQHFGALHLAVNVAGVEGERAMVADMMEDNWDRVMGINAKGVFNCMQVELRQMLAQIKDSKLREENSQISTEQQQLNVGSRSAEEVIAEVAKPVANIDRQRLAIVNMASTAGQKGMAEFAAYSASKHAVIGLTRSAAREYAKYGIRINAVCPSTTATPMVERFQIQWPDWQQQQNSSFPSQRIASPEEVAEAVCWLLLGSCPMAVGTCLLVDGGITA